MEWTGSMVCENGDRHHLGSPESIPTDAYKVVFTLMSFADSSIRSHWLDPGMQTHGNKTHKDTDVLKKKKDDFINSQHTTEKSGISVSAW